MHEGEFQGSQGSAFYRGWEPDGPPVRFVQIGHGRCASEPVLITLSDGGRHEVLNEINRDGVLSDPASWIDSVA
jgi:alpha-beta hydrolase superfamily lysophospholipase